MAWRPVGGGKLLCSRGIYYCGVEPTLASLGTSSLIRMENLTSSCVFPSRMVLSVPCARYVYVNVSLSPLCT